MSKIIESSVFKLLLNNRNNKETFNTNELSRENIKILTNYQLVAMIISVIITQLLLLLLGKWLWNTYLVNTVSGVKPLESIGHLIAISLLLKLLIN
jgi:hypothetical protein